MNTEVKKINIKGKEYVTVAERIRQFHIHYKNGTIQSTFERIELENDTLWNDTLWIVKAVVTPDITKPERYFVGHAQELESSSYINKTSALENAETSAWGRALGCLGLDIDNIASAEEMQKAQNRTIAMAQNPSFYYAKVAEENHKIVKSLSGVEYIEDKQVFKIKSNKAVLNHIKGLGAKICDAKGNLIK